MIAPVQGNQGAALPSGTPNPTTALLSQARYRDSLQRPASPSRPFFFSRCLEVISQSVQYVLNCFKKLLSYFFKTTPSLPAPSNAALALREIAERDKFLWFYKKEENAQTAFLGNFHPCSVSLWGLHFVCAEAAFQAAKFASNAVIMEQFQYLDGESAFRLGQRLSHERTQQEIAAWHGRSLDIMRQVVHAKFSQNSDLKELLLATGNAYLVEHPPRGRDGFWGDNGDGSGHNHLGEIVMQQRQLMGGIGPVPRNPQYNYFLTLP